MNRRRTAAVALVALVSVAYAAPAQASDDVLVSNTGSGFAETLEQPLFDPALRWVPGDTRSSTFYVKNNSADRATLSLSVLDDDAGGLLDSGALHLQVTSPGIGWSPDPHDPGDLLTSEAVLAPGRSLPVRVRVAFDPHASNRTQLLSSELRIRVGLRQAGRAGLGPASAPGAGPDGADRDPGHAPWDLLPDTGLPAGLSWLLLFAALSLGTGIALVTRRNDDHGESHVH
ncbi:MAG: hypothetical protein ABWX84_10975 [Nocardioides sp.]